MDDKTLVEMLAGWSDSEFAYSVLFYGSALAFGVCLGVWLLP